MANTVFPAIKEYMEGASGLDWLSGKFKIYAVDLDTAGPASGAWTISTVAFVSGSNQVQIGTSVAHGAVVGDMVALSGIVSTPWTRPQNNLVDLNYYYKLSTSNGKKYRCVKGGTTANVANPTFSTTDGAFIIDGTAVFMCDGPETVSPYNGNYTIVDVPGSNLLRVPSVFIPSTSTGGKVTNLSKTYLSDFAPSGSRAASAALTGKSILTGGVLDCADFTLDGGTVSREALVLAKAAALDTDPTDLADTAQRLVAYWDSMSGLPIASSSGPGTWSISNGPDRLIRL